MSDYFLRKEEFKNEPDVVAFHVVTVGHKASEYCKKLFNENKYTEYLYFHGLGVETAEALAEWSHKRIRTELNIHYDDAKEIRKLLGQGYQGTRYSFGYPVCPHLEDQTKIFNLIKPDSMIEDVFGPLISKKQLALYKHDGFFHAMDTYQDMQDLNDMWRENPAWKIWH